MAVIKPFWRAEPLTPEETLLLDAVLVAHARSASRGNLSGQVAEAAAIGSGSYTQAICAAMLTTGGVHAPLAQTMHILEKPEWAAERARQLLEKGRKVPGWGNSFIKGRKDDLWIPVDEILDREFEKLSSGILRVTWLLHERKKMIFPNPSAYTAATALALGIPPQLAPWIFFRGRLDAWTEMIAKRKEEIWAQP